MELGKCVVEKQSEVVTTSSVGLWTTTPAAVDIDDIFGVVGSDVQQQPSTLSPRTLTPLGGGLQHANSTRGPQQSSVNPLLPWSLGPLGGGIKGGVQPGQSTLGPLSPWNVGPRHQP